MIFVVVAATLVAALLLFLNLGDRSNPFVGGPSADTNAENQPGNRHLGSSNSNREVGNDSRGGNDAVTLPNNSEPKQNSPADGGEPEPTGDPIWFPIEQLPDLSHDLYVAPRWLEDVVPQTSPEGYDESWINFVESAEGRLGGSKKYHPRTNNDGAVCIEVRFLPDVLGDRSSDERAVEWVEVRSSLTGQGWRLAPLRVKKAVWSRPEIMVPLVGRDVLVVRAKQAEGGIAEALVTRMGLGWEDWPNRQKLNDHGRVTLHLWPLDTLESFAACVATVTDVSGSPASDAIVLYRSQVLGRTDASGRVEFKLPAVLPGREGDPDNVISVWKPGYVPMFVERSELEASSWDLDVTLKARELLVVVPEAPVPEENLVRENSRILSAGNDLIPVPDHMELGWDWQVFLDNLKGTYTDEIVQGIAFKDGALDSKLGFPQGLERALGIKRRDHWPKTYGCWYHNRWQYNNGNYEVCLPYAGKFVLLLGEQEGGKHLTHVLLIDARDPGKPVGKLLKRPGY